MKKLLSVLIFFSLSVITTTAQTKADSLRADSIFKSLELQGVEVVKPAVYQRPLLHILEDGYVHPNDTIPPR